MYNSEMLPFIVASPGLVAVSDGVKCQIKLLSLDDVTTFVGYKVAIVGE